MAEPYRELSTWRCLRHFWTYLKWLDDRKTMGKVGLRVEPPEELLKHG